MLDYKPSTFADAEIEQRVLANSLANDAYLSAVAANLPANAFYNSGHRELYSELIKRLAVGKPTDSTTIAFGVGESMAKLVQSLITLSDPFSSPEIDSARLIDLFRQRTLAEACAQTLTELQSANTFDSAIDSIQARFTQALASHVTQKCESMEAALMSALERIELERAGQIRKVYTGFARLDGLLKGIRGGQLLILGAKTGGGKTTYALNLAKAIAKQSHPVLFISQEMTSHELMLRLISAESDLDHSLLLEPERMVEREMGLFTQTFGDLSTLPFETFSGSVGIPELRALLNLFLMRHGRAGLVVVDYIQLMKTHGGGNRQESVAQLSRGLKEMAMASDCAVLALTQLNDQGELRESRAIGQDADVVMILERDEQRPNIVACNVKKCRHSATGTFDLLFDKWHAKFREV